MPDWLVMWIDRIATIKAGMIGAVVSGGLGVLENIDWLAVLGALVALLTAIAQLVRVWTDIQRHNREKAKAKRFKRQHEKRHTGDR